jgi:hypothetical protein
MNDMMDWGPHRHPALRGLRLAGLVILGVIAAAAFALAFGYFVMLLWNWLMPAIFGLGVITYWQAFGIVILAKLIFGAVGGRGGHNGGWRKRKPGGKASDWGGPERWRYWREFWEQEGRQAFERYTERRRGEKPGEPERETL